MFIKSKGILTINNFSLFIFPLGVLLGFENISSIIFNGSIILFNAFLSNNFTSSPISMESKELKSSLLASSVSIIDNVQESKNGTSLLLLKLVLFGEFKLIKWTGYEISSSSLLEEYPNIKTSSSCFDIIPVS